MDWLTRLWAYLKAKHNLRTEHECLGYVTDFTAGTFACRTCGREMLGDEE